MQPNLDLSGSACALMLRNLPQILFPLVLLRMALADTILQEVRRKVALPFSLSFRILLAILHASPRAHRSCLSVSSWDRSSNFGAYGLRSWGHVSWITPSDGPFPSRVLFMWRSVFIENCTARAGLKTVVPFRKIELNFGGSTSWITQPNCREFFSMATAPSSRSFFRLIAGLTGWPSTCWCTKAHLSPNLHSDCFL